MCFLDYTATDMDNDIEEDQCQIGEEMKIKSWFKGKGALFRTTTHATEQNHQCVIAGDVPISTKKGTGKGTKQYASFPTHTDLAQIIFNCFEKNESCPLYEIIQYGKSCNLYIDCEWWKTDTCAQCSITTLIYHMREFVTHTYGIEGIVMVTTSSRVKDDGFKESYHLTFPNVSFVNNTSDMKRFIDKFKEQHKDTEALWADGTFIVDTGVYTQGRPMRTILSCKEDDKLKTKLMPIEYIGDSWVPITVTGKKQLLDYFVTNVGSDTPLLSYTEQVHKSDKKSTTKRKRPETTPQTEAPSDRNQIIPPETQLAINALLVHNQLKYTVRGTIRDGCEVDLHNPDRGCPFLKSGDVHKSQNQYISMSKGKCYFRCYTKRCKGCYFDLGSISTQCVDVSDDVIDSDISNDTEQLTGDAKRHQIEDPNKTEIDTNHVEIQTEKVDYQNKNDLEAVDIYDKNR
jgi:hypothetical protein